MDFCGAWLRAEHYLGIIARKPFRNDSILGPKTFSMPAWSRSWRSLPVTMNPVKLAPLGGKSGPDTPEESESFDMFGFYICILSDMFRQDSMRPTARVIMDKLLLGPLMTGAFLGLGLELGDAKTVGIAWNCWILTFHFCPPKSKIAPEHRDA